MNLRIQCVLAVYSRLTYFSSVVAFAIESWNQAVFHVVKPLR